MWLYSVFQDEELGPCVSFVDKEFWEKNRRLDDESLTEKIPELSGCFEELEEGTFFYDGTEQQMLRELTHLELDNGNFERSKDLDEFLNKTVGSKGA